MAKTLSPKQIEKIKARDARELAKREKEQQRVIPTWYFAVMIGVLVLIYCIDEIASRSNNVMQYDIFLDFFKAKSSNDASYIEGNDRFKTLQIVAGQIMLLAPFYKALADKYGRRAFLALNTIIFGIAMLITAFSTGLMTYLIGILLVTLVSSNDIQVMYIMETAPEKHRAKMASIIKAVAVASTALLGLLRTIFYDPADPSWWKPVFLIPAIVALVIGTVAYFISRETPVFLQDRIAYLRKTPEERQQEALERKSRKKASGTGVFSAVKYVFSNRQTTVIAIATLLVAMAITSTNYGNYIIDNSEKWTAVVSIYPFFGALFTFGSGFISDKFGRKSGACVFCLACALFFGLYVVGSANNWNTLLLACFYGLFHGAIYCVVDVVCVFLPGESVRTGLRASVMAVLSLILYAGEYIGGFVVGKIAKAIGGVTSKDLVSPNVWGNVSLFWTIPLLVLASLLIVSFVKETKGADLTSVGQEE